MTGTGRPGRTRERGSVTAELAVGLAPVAVLLLLAAWLAAAGAVQVRVQVAAGSAARALARGEEPAVVVARTSAAAGDGADVARRLEQAGGTTLVRVRVTVPLHVPVLGAVARVGAEAVSPVEADAGSAEGAP